MIKESFARCQSGEKNDKAQIKAMKADPDLKNQLKTFYANLRGEDVITLFNWFIGTNFGISIREL